MEMKNMFGMMLEITLKVLGDGFNIEVRAFFKPDLQGQAWDRRTV